MLDAQRHMSLIGFQVVSALSWLEVNETVQLWLRADSFGVIKKVPQGVDLCRGDGKHDKQVKAGPEGHPPKVVLQKVAIPRLKGPQGTLDLAGPLQVQVHELHACLEEEEEKGRQWEIKVKAVK